PLFLGQTSSGFTNSRRMNQLDRWSLGRVLRLLDRQLTNHCALDHLRRYQIHAVWDEVATRLVAMRHVAGTTFSPSPYISISAELDDDDIAQAARRLEGPRPAARSRPTARMDPRSRGASSTMGSPRIGTCCRSSDDTQGVSGSGASSAMSSLV